MNEWITEKRKVIRIFLEEYGKLFLSFGIVLSSLLLLVNLFSLITPHTLTVSFLDVGQGDAILIQTPSGHTMLIDGGPSDGVLEKLSSKLGYFNHHIDVMVETHPDADHITGLIPVLAKYTVDTIITSPLLGHTGVSDALERSVDEEQAHVHVGKKGDEIIFGDGVIATILHPPVHFRGNEKDTNDASVSMVVTYGAESVLLTGDLPSVDEGALLSDTLPHHVTIYKAGHHGSKYSSGDQLLSYIHPEYSVVSVGKNNRYGHPNPEALNRLTAYSQEILSTTERGTVTFLLDGETAQMATSK
jgi:beta-lactamase superfamily II metal-dependent hydrolase